MIDATDKSIKNGKIDESKRVLYIIPKTKDVIVRLRYKFPLFSTCIRPARIVIAKHKTDSRYISEYPKSKYKIIETQAFENSRIK
jgi:hypothetical protein